MATVIGISGAWKDVLQQLQRIHITVSHPDEISKKLLILKQECAVRFKKNQIQRDEQLVKLLVERDNQLKQVETDILKLEQAQVGIFGSIVKWFKQWFLQARKRSVVNSYRSQQVQIERRTLEDEFITSRYRTISQIKNVLNSTVFTGSRAELAIIAILSELPPTYYVLNDVRLRAKHHLKFNHKVVQSAQIDHLVVAPTGVFVVEVKNWSQHFANSGKFFDPYEQVGRANYLCHCLLKEDLGIQMTVRSILAYRGHVPPPPKDSKYIKVLPIEEVTSYVRRFERQAPLLSATQVENIVKAFHP
jgi:hypothetical protein